MHNRDTTKLLQFNLDQINGHATIGPIKNNLINAQILDELADLSG